MTVTSRYRWAVLAAGTAAQASFSTIGFGLPAIAPALRDEFALDLQGVGVLLAAEWVGLSFALLPWGLAVDRIGERLALLVGLGGCGALVASAALVDSFAAVVAVLAAGGAAGASVQAASGRAVMHWFAPEERGLAFGVRQTAVTAGGVVGALAVPAVVAAGGVDAAFVFLGAFCIVAALAGAAFIRDAHEHVEADAVEWSLRDRRLWILCSGSGFYVAAQVALVSFLVLYLHDERGLSAARAAAVLALISGLAAALRIGAGRWSDVLRSRIVPLRRIGLAVVATLAAATALLDAPNVVVVPLLVAAGALSAAWNGLSFAAAAELAGRARSGAAIGFQQTVLSVVGVVVPPAFALVVATSSWRTAFAAAAAAPLAGWVLLGRVRI